MQILKQIGGSLKGFVVRVTERFPFIKRKLFYIPAAIVLVIIGGSLVFGGPQAPEFETAVAARQNVVQTVSETGEVEPEQEVDLSFTGSGRVTNIYVTEGETVRAGTLLATLDGARAYAELLSARARLKQVEANAQSSGRTLEQTKAQQDQLVENARRALISGDLQAYLTAGGSDNSSRDFTPPTISGTYDCSQEGTYRIELYSSSAQSGGSFRFTGLESGHGTISTTGPVPLGNCGLYIEFPEDFALNPFIVWEVPVPNVRSSTYQTRKNAYEAALETRRLTLEQAEVSPLRQAQIEEAQAIVSAAEAAYADTRLTAPFAGLVTNVDAVRGAIATIGTPAVSLISSEAFEMTILVPEDDIGELGIGDTASVSFDAYDGLTLPATVYFISPRANNDSGAAQFEVKLHFVESEDERIRAGLSVDVDIIAAEAQDVIAIPTRAIIEEDGVRFVRVMTGETSYRRAEVKTGLSGTGMTEILSGLSEGDRFITFANEEALDVLTEEN